MNESEEASDKRHCEDGRVTVAELLSLLSLLDQMSSWSAKTLLKPLAAVLIGIIAIRYIGFSLQRSCIRSIVARTSSVLVAHNITYWWDFGTSLGLYRDHDIIWGETDADISVTMEDRNRIWDEPAIHQSLYQAGFVQMDQRDPLKLRIYDSWGWFLDMDVWQREKNATHDRLQMLTGRHCKSVYNTPYEWVLPPSSLVVEEVVHLLPLSLPRDMDAWLTFWYGDWHTPRGFDKGRDWSGDDAEVALKKNFIFALEAFSALKAIGRTFSGLLHNHILAVVSACLVIAVILHRLLRKEWLPDNDDERAMMVASTLIFIWALVVIFSFSFPGALRLTADDPTDLVDC